MRPELRGISGRPPRSPRSPPVIRRHGQITWPAGTHGDGRIVDCPRCGDRLKPNTVCLGENVRKAHAEQGYSMVDGAETSSLTARTGATRPPAARRPEPAGCTR